MFIVYNFFFVFVHDEMASTRRCLLISTILCWLYYTHYTLPFSMVCCVYERARAHTHGRADASLPHFTNFLVFFIYLLLRCVLFGFILLFMWFDSFEWFCYCCCCCCYSVCFFFFLSLALHIRTAISSFPSCGNNLIEYWALCYECYVARFHRFCVCELFFFFFFSFFFLFVSSSLCRTSFFL